ncbi:MAG: AAA family ATPase [Treponema sp.]|nr:AAA family ATPase [Treponema sp.]
MYVDKTEFVYNLSHVQSPYFLSRPRRFGKSLNRLRHLRRRKLAA